MTIYCRRSRPVLALVQTCGTVPGCQFRDRDDQVRRWSLVLDRDRHRSFADRIGGYAFDQ